MPDDPEESGMYSLIVSYENNLLNNELTFNGITKEETKYDFDKNFVFSTEEPEHFVICTKKIDKDTKPIYSGKMRFVFYDNSNIAPNTDVPPTLLLSPFD
jgi:hypothetical protein